jgi:cytochrome c oxidase subunit 2
MLHSVFDAAGPQSARIAQVWWLLFAVTGIVYVVVLTLFFMALARRRRDIHPLSADAARRHARTVFGATAATVVIVFVLLVIDIWGGRGMNSPTAEAATHSAVTIDVVGHQWWWEVQYVDQNPSQTVIGANEIHIPVGRPVIIRARSADVIHSFWVPSLHGKRDLIPGYQTAFWIQADREGVFRGQCAEFCGHQHARMALVVVAEREPAFDAWLTAQRQPAQQPSDEEQRKGEEVFMSAACVMCHTVTGTPAGGKAGPDLTHVGSRWTIAAGTLPNTRGHLAGWVLDAQSVKPGSRMPPVPLRGEDLQPLLAYLQNLK